MNQIFKLKRLDTKFESLLSDKLVTNHEMKNKVLTELNDLLKKMKTKLDTTLWLMKSLKTILSSKYIKTRFLNRIKMSFRKFSIFFRVRFDSVCFDSGKF